jgi:hypothetical protein
MHLEKLLSPKETLNCQRAYLYSEGGTGDLLLKHTLRTLFRMFNLPKGSFLWKEQNKLFAAEGNSHPFQYHRRIPQYQSSN